MQEGKLPVDVGMGVEDAAQGDTAMQRQLWAVVRKVMLEDLHCGYKS